MPVYDNDLLARQALLEVFRTAREAESVELVVVDDKSPTRLLGVESMLQELRSHFGTRCVHGTSGPGACMALCDHVHACGAVQPCACMWHFGTRCVHGCSGPGACMAAGRGGAARTFGPACLCCRCLGTVGATCLCCRCPGTVGAACLCCRCPGTVGAACPAPRLVHACTRT